MKAIALISLLAAGVGAVPQLRASIKDPNPLAHPFVYALMPVSPLQDPGASIFKRQGCPNLTSLCSTGVCCGYDNPCCGNTCCPQGYVCSGGTASAPCCVAIGASSNSCGSSSNNNPCARPGDLPCQGINICCPPSNLCYYDTSGVARCSPLATSSPTPSPRASLSPLPSSIITPTSQSYPSGSPHSSHVGSSSILPVPQSSASPPPASASSTSTTSSRSSFWTPGVIAGISVGSFFGLVFFALLIWCCCRRPGRDDSRQRPGPHYTVPLTDAQIRSKIQYLDTPQQWQAAYTAEAHRMRSAPHADPVSWMTDFAKRCVALRVQQMRGGDVAENTYTKAGFWGLIPLGKLADSFFGWSTKRFYRVMLESVGLGDIAATEDLFKRAETAAKATSLGAKVWSGAQWLGQQGVKEWWNYAESAEHLKDALSQFLVNEFGFDAATAFLQELVHIKFFVGQGISVGKAVHGVNEKMIKALQWVEPVALEYHIKAFVTNAVVEAFPHNPEPYKGEEKEKTATISQWEVR